jgi:DNA ligase 1
MVKKRTVRKSKKNNNSAYFEYKSGNSRKFWRIVKNGSKITTHYGRIGSLGQMTTKDYGIKVDLEYDKLIQSKKKKWI